MTLYEVTTGWCGESYYRCYVWAVDGPKKEWNNILHYKLKPLLTHTDGPFVTGSSDERVGAPNIMTCPYQTLCVPKDAPAEYVTKVYRRLAKKFHPDRNPGDADAAARYRELTDAYEVLSDPIRRKHYDETGDAGSSTGRADAQIITVLSGVLVAAVQKAYGRMGSAEHSHIVTEMRKELNHQIEEGDKVFADLQRSAKEYEAVAARFTVFEGEPNVLADVARQHAKTCLADLATVRGKQDLLRRALGVLEKYGYTVEKTFDGPPGGLFPYRRITTSNSTW